MLRILKTHNKLENDYVKYDIIIFLYNKFNVIRIKGYMKNKKALIEIGTSMIKKIDTLQRTSLFKNISREDIELMIKCLSVRSVKYKKNEFVFNAGDEINEIGVVITGSVNLIREDFWGNRFIFEKIGPSGMFGETIVFAETNNLPVSVVASQDTEILYLCSDRIITTCSSACKFHNNLIHNMVQIISNKNVMLTQKINNISKRTTRDKIISFLSFEAMRNKSNTFKIQYSRQELADYLSVDRSALSRELSKLQNEKRIAFNKNMFTLLSEE